MVMFKLLSFLKSLLPSIQTQEERDEAYLAEAVDLYDLERRIREIDERVRYTRGPGPGVYLPCQ